MDVVFMQLRKYERRIPLSEQEESAAASLMERRIE
jgi:hypothetical protein